MSSHSTSCLGRGLKIVGCVLLGIGIIYFLVTINLRSLGLPIGDWPRLPFYVYTTSKITLTFDGEEIAFEGTTACKRRFELNEDGKLWLPIILDHIGFAYYCEPEWLAHRFDDGSALFVGAYSARSPRPRIRPAAPRPMHFDAAWVVERISQKPPAVIWLDNAETPTRAEYYYSMAVLKDPRSRLTAIHHQAEMWAASLWTSFFTGWGVADPSSQVPAAEKHSKLYGFVAHYAVELPKERWASIDDLQEALASLSGPTMLRPRQQVSEEQFRSLNKMREGISDWRPPRNVKNTAFGVEESRAKNTDPGVDPNLDGAAWTLARSVVPETSNFQAFRFDDSLPRGAVAMFRRSSGRASDSAQFLIGDRPASDSYVAMWFSGYLFDPAANAIYSLYVSTF